MANVTLTQGARTVSIQSAKLDEDISKSWKINPIPTTYGNRAETTLATNASAGATKITVVSATGFKAKDDIFIFSSTGSENNTISSIAGTQFTLANALGSSYSSGDTIAKQGRLISLDFNQIVNSVTIAGKLIASDTETLLEIKNNLKAMATIGGSITVTATNFDTWQDMGITKITMTQIAETNANPEVFDVILNLTKTGQEIGAT